MTLLGRLPGRGEIAAAGTGILLVFLAVLAVGRVGAQLTFALLLGTATFVGFVAGFAFAPHIFVAATIAYFALLPTLQAFFPSIPEGSKELLVAAAVVAAAGLLLRRRGTRLDSTLLILLGLVFGLYVVNIGGGLSGETGHGIAWFHGTRLLAEPLCLFVFGVSVRDPHRTLRWAVAALLGVCLINALYGILQQAIGVPGLRQLGYHYGAEIREISGHVRSFGTLGEPFAYAGLLLLGLVTTLLWYRRSLFVTAALALLGLGLFFSYVRTAALIAVALLALAAARLGRARYAILLMLAALAGAAAVFAAASQKTETRSVQVNPTTYLTLNGRTNIWKATLSSPSDWVFGRGVGATGTASQRAARALASRATKKSSGGSIVDSSYFAVIADVGVLGLGILVTFFATLIARARVAALQGQRSGWLAMGLLSATLLDALTRESFVGFPTAYISLVVVGIAWATWREGPKEEAPVPGIP
jgi:hypothetical protein